MANQVSPVRLLGFRDFFPNEEAKEREFYANFVGKEMLSNYCCYFLSQLTHNYISDTPKLIQDWFTFMGRPYLYSPSYWTVIKEYDRIRRLFPSEAHTVLSEESLLNMFQWANSNAEIVSKVEEDDASVMLHLFELNLIFNDNVLNNYQRAVDSATKYVDKINYRWLLGTSYPQNDIINVDYAVLLFTQFYKLLHLLNFIEKTGMFQKLHEQLLADFECKTNKEFIKAIGGAVFLSFKDKRQGWSALEVEESPDSKKAISFLNKLTLDVGIVQPDQDDYLMLRNKPFQKISDKRYRIIFDLFLVKKLYNGTIFKLSEYVGRQPKLMKENFLGEIRLQFSEEVLVYDVLSGIYESSGAICKNGSEFKKVLKREPDFYVREDNNIMLFESKDFYIPGSIKLSYDFSSIEAELKKDGRLGKAVKQLCTNANRAALRELILDTDYDPNEVKIYPIVIVHDSIYSSPSLNYWVNSWFNEEIIVQQSDGAFKGFEIKHLMPVTLIEIDTLIFYKEHLRKNEISLVQLLGLYHKHVNLNLVVTEAEQLVFQSTTLPFSEFVREYGFQIGLIPNINTLEDIYEKCNLG